MKESRGGSVPEYDGWSSSSEDDEMSSIRAGGSSGGGGRGVVEVVLGDSSPIFASIMSCEKYSCDCSRDSTRIGAERSCRETPCRR